MGGCPDERNCKIIEIYLASSIGFCSGVKKAVETARHLLNEGKLVGITGELVHNHSVMHDLKSRGLRCVDVDGHALSKCVVLIRAHGVPPDIHRRLQEKAMEVVDMTCPIVRQTFLQASLLIKQGYDVFALGKIQHPEMQALQGHAKGIKVIETLGELQKIWNPQKLGINIALQSQTTVSEALFLDVAHWMVKSLKPFQNLRVVNTICPVSKARQQEVHKMAQIVDGMIVVGGKNSSNTLKLVDVARSHLDVVYHIEHPTEIEAFQDMLHSTGKFGIISGTSTPLEDVWMTKQIILRNTGG